MFRKDTLPAVDAICLDFRGCDMAQDMLGSLL